MNNIRRHAFIFALCAPVLALASNTGESDIAEPLAEANEREAATALADAKEEDGDVVITLDGGRTLRIPTPAGFLSISSNPKLQKFFGDIDAAKTEETVLGHWVTTTSGTLVEAIAGRPKQNVESVSLSFFQEMRRGIEKYAESTPKDVMAIAEQLAEKMNKAAAEGLGAQMLDVKVLPIHASDQRSFQFSIIRIQLERLEEGGKPQETYTALTSGIVWTRNHIFTISVSLSLTAREDLEVALSLTRERASAWLEAIFKANGLNGEIPSTEAALGLGVFETLTELYPEDGNGTASKAAPTEKGGNVSETIGKITGLVMMLVFFGWLFARAARKNRESKANTGVGTAEPTGTAKPAAPEC